MSSAMHADGNAARLQAESCTSSGGQVSSVPAKQTQSFCVAVLGSAVPMLQTARRPYNLSNCGGSPTGTAQSPCLAGRVGSGIKQRRSTVAIFPPSNDFTLHPASPGDGPR
eukprot:CAMPEP_0117572398 /NCGR_PEP_ID=MMETSP0784-20121206/60331_1 /TAXON_ID=39447 /ORGANISM="" /LENGTH=110 /DNA_ID=CAMNT_0005370757 /DNA_START=612 /DNA_END=944 /DNA_ORIENTATION=-